LVADSVNVPEPDFESAPKPEITPVCNIWFEFVAIESVPDVPIAIAPEYVPEPSVPVTEIVPPDAAMDVLPVYVLVPESVKVPAPCLVSEPEPIPTAPEMIVVPTLSTTRSMFVAVTPPDNVNCAPEST
jgi:hypothetical protein